MKSSLIFIIILSLSVTGFCQKPVDLKLKSGISDGRVSCFDIQLRSPAGHDIDIAGQNYRLFYNADKMSFLPERITHDLDPKTYSKIDLINTNDDDIGFVSISIDGKALTDKVLKLTRNGDWLTSLNICFDHAAEQSIDLTWANRRKTALYATAEVALSEWENKENQQILLPNEIVDFSSSTEGDNSMKGTIDVNVFPNPVSDYINISLGTDRPDGELIIKDVIGRELVRKKVDGESLHNFQLNKWPEGTYTVLLVDPNGKKLHAQNVIKINP